jgi:hypothetical protein
MSDWLAEEMACAAGNVRQLHLDHIKSLGVDSTAIASLGTKASPFGIARVRRCSSGYFEPSECGRMAVIVPVTWPEYCEGLTCSEFVRWPIVDLVAFRTDTPADWLSRTGAAWALGEHLLEHWEGEPVPIVATPLDWLCARGDAACILDWSASSPAWPALRMVSELHVQDDRLAVRLRQAIDRTAPRPRIIGKDLRRAA